MTATSQLNCLRLAHISKVQPQKVGAKSRTAQTSIICTLSLRLINTSHPTMKRTIRHSISNNFCIKLNPFLGELDEPDVGCCDVFVGKVLAVPPFWRSNSTTPF